MTTSPPSDDSRDLAVFGYRQELDRTFLRNGMCYAVRRAALDAGLGLLGSAPRAIEVEGPVVNIDDAEDLAQARRLLEGGR